MAKELLKGLEIVFLVHFIVGIIIGFIFLFTPEFYYDLFDFDITDHGAFRLIGAASLALGSSSFLAYRTKDWEKSKLFVQMEFIWLTSAIVAMVWWLVDSGPIAGWWILGMFTAFLIAFIYFYILQER